MSQDGSGRRASSKGKVAKVSTLVLLSREGLEEYYTYFQQAGFSMFDGDAHPSDLMVEQYIAETEKHCGIAFLPEVRIRLWKALRYQWFRGQTVAPFIERSQVRPIFLPKLDYTEVDSMVRIPDIDPDRRRQFIRTTRPSSQPSFRGPAVINLQFEVYKRQDDIYHELQDIERCVNEWQNRNARTMLPEDPREEIMRLRIRGIQEEVGMTLISRRITVGVQRRVRLLLVFLRFFMLGMTCIHAGAAYYRYMDAPRELILWLIFGSRPFVCGACYFLAYMVAFVVAKRWHYDAKSLKLQRLEFSCQRLTESISDFRVETEGQRMSPEETFEAGFSIGQLPREKKPKKKKGRQRNGSRDRGGIGGEGDTGTRKRRPKREKDEVMAMWAGKNAHKRMNLEGMLAIKKQVEESYKRLEQVAVPDHKRPDGNRMALYAAKVGMPENYEDKLCIRVPRAPRPPAEVRNLPRALPAPVAGHSLVPAAPRLPGPPPRPVDRSLAAVTRSFVERTSPPRSISTSPRSRRPTSEVPALPPPPDTEDSGDGSESPDDAARLAPWLPAPRRSGGSGRLGGGLPAPD